jgi:hypothetical protein
MTLSWNELACHGLLKKIDREMVSLIMVHLRPLREKWIKYHGTGEVEKYIMENGINGARELFETPYISKEMWCKAALRKEFKTQWWWRAPEKRREKCYNVVNASIIRYSASTWGPQPITGMPDELLKNDVHGVYETLDDGRAVERQWDDKWSREKDSIMREPWAEASGLGTHASLRAKWYQNIHEGRYFLFFKMNEQLKTRIQKRVGYVDEKYCPEIVCGRWGGSDAVAAKGVRACDIMGFFPDQQGASDLLTIDGPGINHPKGKEVMHIDDIFH